uniref:PDZ domain-containing protein n=1 Tax=Panagrolaimus superbus TaxID=310955 RepID=A0A914YYS3_9BILA
MSGHVPNQKQYCQCSILSNADDPASVSILNRKMQQTSTNLINVPGSNLSTSSTILRHPPFISSSTTSAKDHLHVNDTYGFRSQSPCSDGTLELPPSMPPPKSQISAGSGLDDKVSSPRRLSSLLMMLSEQQIADFPMIDATSPIRLLETFNFETFTVHLRKDPHSRTFGFSVSDGDKSNHGVYINTISPGSPADRCGNIHPFDRILKINSTDIRDLHCNLAVPLLAADEVDLLLERMIPQNPRSRPRHHQQLGPAVQSAV